ncbi:MAG TPA: VOC family protein [Geminicoccus sp.]|uniref:VOC family protein n=1 Tax=Geminicoccus sp. TaxID=2024832 RepID=UPI002CAA352C|nr:VOC family protein [Geminicoccus sp.]HWL68640.1 VOC family protein [Geminicoccus sp.]
MPQFDLTLDHAALLVRRLARAAPAFERLGFQIAPRLPHQGQLEPGGRTQAFGTAGCCITLDGSYLELVEATGETAYAQAIAERAARREGVHFLGLATDELTRLHRVLGEELPGLAPPRSLVREWPLDGATRPASFRLIQLDGRCWPDADLALVEHHSRQVIWPDVLPVHPNGARRLVGVTLVVRDPQASRGRLARLLGRPHGAHFRLAQGRLSVIDLVSAVRRFPGLRLAEPPFPAALAIEVASLRRVEGLLLRNGVTPRHSANGTLWVAPADAGGAVLEFTTGQVEHRDIQVTQRHRSAGFSGEQSAAPT